MKAVRFGVLAALATAAAALAAGTGSAASDVVGQLYVNDNAAIHNTVAGFDRRIGRQPDAARGHRRSGPVAPARAARPGRRARSSCLTDRRYRARRRRGERRHLRPAGRKPTARSSLVGTTNLATARPRQHRRPPRPRVRRQRRRRWQRLHRLPPRPSRPSHAHPGLDRGAARLGDARRGPVQRRRQHPRRDACGSRHGTSFIDSFRVGHDGRLTAAPGSPFPAQRIGPFGSEFRPTDPTPAVRLERPRRRRERQRVGLHRRQGRDPHRDRRLAVRGRPDRAVLGRDQPRRPVPVRDQHRRIDSISRYSIAAERRH